MITTAMHWIYPFPAAAAADPLMTMTIQIEPGMHFVRLDPPGALPCAGRPVPVICSFLVPTTGAATP